MRRGRGKSSCSTSTVRITETSVAHSDGCVTGRVEAMEKRLDATLGAVKTMRPALAKFYNSLSDEQKALFNSLCSASCPAAG